MTCAKSYPKDDIFLDAKPTVKVRVAQGEAENAAAEARHEAFRQQHEERVRIVKALIGNPDALCDVLAELSADELGELAGTVECVSDVRELFEEEPTVL